MALRINAYYDMILLQVDCYNRRYKWTSSTETESETESDVDLGIKALMRLRRFSPMAAVHAQIAQLMEIDDGSDRFEQALRAVRLVQQQHGPEALFGLFKAPASFRNMFS